MGLYLRGAFVELVPTGLVAIPNVIAFQYNPETLTHTWAPARPERSGAEETQNPFAVQNDPDETISFTLFLNSEDAIADNTPESLTARSIGLYPRLAALELLLFPRASTVDGLLGTVTAAVGALAAARPGTQAPVPANVLNTVLFAWGPGRILPVLVTQMTVTERLYDAVLNPTHVEVQITLHVLNQVELDHDQDALSAVARAAAQYSRGLRKALAVTNTVNGAASLVGLTGI